MKRIKTLFTLLMLSPLAMLAQAVKDTAVVASGVAVGSIVIPTAVAVIIGIAIIHAIQLIWPTKTNGTFLGTILQTMLDLLNKLPNNVKKV